MIEQRKLERFDLRVPATIEVVAEHQNPQKKILHAMTKNICAGGAFFNTTPYHLAEGTQVKIGLVLKFGGLRGLAGRRARLKASGRVLRSESNGFIIRFDKSYKLMPINNV
jgi:hypothetical protein